MEGYRYWGRGIGGGNGCGEVEGEERGWAHGERGGGVIVGRVGGVWMRGGEVR